MTRTEQFRDARRDSRARVFASPIRVAPPLIATGIVLLLTVVTAALAGLPATTVLIIAGAVLIGCAIAAQRTIASMFAGLTLWVVRPYAAGERVRIQSPTDGCPINVVIVHIGVANTTLAADSGLLVVPNHLLLRTPPTAAPAAEPCPEPSA